ncbi:MAG: hypothetical protein JNL79_18295 [Myxococcales bacterium]|nr:hypothetical protein [Myxococcales bacterium]
MNPLSPTRLAASGLLLLLATGCTRTPDRAIASEPSASAIASTSSVPTVKPATLDEAQREAFDSADAIVVGTLVAPKIEHVLEIDPPIFVHSFSLALDKRLLGGALPSTVTAVHYSSRDVDKPFAAGARVVVALRRVEGTLPTAVTRFSALLVAPATPALEAAAAGATAPDGLALAVAQVPAAKVIKWQNEYGDGEFDLTLKNEGKAPLTVPGVYVVGGKVAWDSALTVRDERGRLLSPSHAALPDGATPLVLAPGATLTHRVDVKPFGLVSPMGGYSPEYSFRVGALRTSSWFYYTHTLHGPKMGKV